LKEFAGFKANLLKEFAGFKANLLKEFAGFKANLLKEFAGSDSRGFRRESKGKFTQEICRIRFAQIQARIQGQIHPTSGLYTAAVKISIPGQKIRTKNFGRRGGGL
ncbi:MAG: hypothetical protein LBK41_05345, partial [Clostridiales bacterium]|nr:hypothetical protein [Clostridiales bacterium]